MSSWTAAKAAILAGLVAASAAPAATAREAAPPAAPAEFSGTGWVSYLEALAAVSLRFRVEGGSVLAADLDAGYAELVAVMQGSGQDWEASFGADFRARTTSTGSGASETTETSSAEAGGAACTETQVELRSPSGRRHTWTSCTQAQWTGEILTVLTGLRLATGTPEDAATASLGVAIASSSRETAERGSEIAARMLYRIAASVEPLPPAD